MDKMKKLNRFAVLDIEALFIPLEGEVPVSELACAVIDMERGVLDTFHRLVSPSRTAEGVHEKFLEKEVYENVCGLSRDVLSKEGWCVEEVSRDLENFMKKHEGVAWVARDPTLENRVLRQWGIEIVSVVEVLHCLQPRFGKCLFVKKNRPLAVRKWAETHMCPHHHNGARHCAIADVMEECSWLWQFQKG